MSEEVVCPSGFSGRIRALKVKEERLFQDPKLLKSGGLIQELIKRCWEGTTSAGPYPFDGDKVDWSQVLEGDATYLFFRVRAMTYGEEYDITLQCEACNKAIDHTVNLAEDLRQQKLPEVSAQAVSSGEPMSLRLPSGVAVQFKLLTLADRRKVEQLEDHRKLTPANARLAAHLVAVEGAGEHPFAIIRWLEDLGSGEAQALSEQIDQFDCGVDTVLELVCPHCYFDQEQDLPLGGSFFQRRSRKKRRRERLVAAQSG